MKFSGIIIFLSLNLVVKKARQESEISVLFVYRLLLFLP